MWGEARALHFRTTSGAPVLGSELIDPFWERILHWATVEQPRRVAEERAKAVLVAQIRELPHADAVLREFDALSSPAPAA